MHSQLYETNWHVHTLQLKEQYTGMCVRTFGGVSRKSVASKKVPHQTGQEIVYGSELFISDSWINVNVLVALFMVETIWGYPK